jgi:PAS domain S-box-containing protein
VRSTVDRVKILLVDDEPRNLNALEAILEPNNYTLIRAQTADEALLSILQNEFAAIIMDIKMPGTGGLELAHLIKQRKQSEHIPILFLTAYSLEEGEILRAYGVGGVDFLSKPINPDILRSKIAVFAELFRTTRALASTVEELNDEIQERQRAQEELRLAKDELEARVLERTAELARANREIRDNEERLKLALTVAQVATWEWNLETGRMRWSSDPEATFGFPAGSFGPELRISHAVHPDDGPMLELSFQRAMQTGDYDAEYRVVRPDGSMVWIAERGRLIQDSADQSKRIVGVSVDITKRKCLEEALLASDKSKDEFLATLAHELRNPLAPIRYAVKVLDFQVPPTTGLRRAIDIIEQQTQHMARLIDDLLDINRISRNTLALRKETTDLAAVIKAAAEASRPMIEQNQQELIIREPAGQIYLHADPVRLIQVFSNLLNNASKYSKIQEGGTKIWLSYQRDGNQVVVTVRDSGIGIPAPMLPKIFDMFTQVRREIGHSDDGLGIGLALSKRLVEMHDGGIDVQSEGVGKGSEFHVRLPVLDVVPQPAAKPDAAAKKSRVKKRILIADDNPDILEIFQMMLEMRGHEVETAVNGFEVLRKADEFRPDVVALDIGMPKLDGFETARQLRLQPWARDTLLVAITGWGGDSYKKKSAESGFDAHLTKPIDVIDFENLLEGMKEPRADLIAR